MGVTGLVPSTVANMTFFPISQNITEGTDSDQRLGSKISCRYLTVIITAGGGIDPTAPGDSRLLTVVTNSLVPQARFVFTVYMVKRVTVHDGALTTNPRPEDYYNIIESTHTPKTWVKAKERNRFGTIVFQKMCNYRTTRMDIPNQANALLKPRVWKYNIKLPFYQTTWSEYAGDQPEANHLFWTLQRVDDNVQPYSDFAININTKLYFTP